MVGITTFSFKLSHCPLFSTSDSKLFGLPLSNPYSIKFDPSSLSNTSLSYSLPATTVAAAAPLPAPPMTPAPASPSILTTTIKLSTFPLSDLKLQDHSCPFKLKNFKVWCQVSFGANRVLTTSLHQKETNSLLSSGQSMDKWGITTSKNDHSIDNSDNQKSSTPFLKRKTIEV
ncbi:hypothetical protein glysoja_042505 [Glycine soja]|uniref:Uncharacterized protein n=1 Tax=Glycine soja TaxID=3848 RepID=A0A0B2QS57_GLYSO|nr:hypothetical protein glysoja_042505 [Glycine soja]